MKKFLFLLLAASSFVSAQNAVNPEPVDQTLSSLASSQKLWRASVPATYELTVQRSCFCAPRQISATFDVAGSKSKWRKDNLVDGASVQNWVSVDRLYTAMRNLIKQGGRVAVVFGKNGIPQQIVMDPVPSATDDEQYLAITVK